MVGAAAPDRPCNRTCSGTWRPVGGTGIALAALAARVPVEPVVCGKPSLPLLAALRARLAGRVLVVGDTVAADIEFGHRGGLGSLLVLTGTGAGQSAGWPQPIFVAPDLVTVAS